MPNRTYLLIILLLGAGAADDTEMGLELSLLSLESQNDEEDGDGVTGRIAKAPAGCTAGAAPLGTQGLAAEAETGWGAGGGVSGALPDNKPAKKDMLPRPGKAREILEETWLSRTPRVLSRFA